MSRILQVVGAVVAVCLLMVAAFYADGASSAVRSVADLTRDPTAVADVPWWTGAISRLTALGWVVVATAALLAAERHTSGDHRRPLLLLGGLCVVSALDDSLLFHEEVLPSLGLPEEPFLVLYAAAGVVLGVVWLRSPLLRTSVGLAFFGGAAMLALSILTDAFLHSVIVEDTAKLVGVVAWAFCGVWACTEAARPSSSARPGTAGRTQGAPLVEVADQRRPTYDAGTEAGSSPGVPRG